MSRDWSKVKSPIIRDLAGKVNPQVQDAEYEMLCAVGIIDVAQFFDQKGALDGATTDQARWEKLLGFVQNREADKLRKIKEAKEAEERKIREAQEAEERKKKEAEEKIRKEKEAAEAAKRAEEERIAAAKRAEEEKIAAAKKAEEDKIAAAKKAEEDKLRMAQEEAEAKRRAIAEAKAARERKIKEINDREADKKAVDGVCAGCGIYILKGSKFLESEDDDGKPMYLHSGESPFAIELSVPAGRSCQALWEEKECPPCDHCGDLLTGDYISVTRASDPGLKANLHQCCVDDFKKIELEKAKK